MRCTALKIIIPLALLAIGIVARPAVVEATTLVIDFEDLAVPAAGHFEGTDEVPYDWTHTDNPWVSNGVTFHNWWSLEHYQYEGTWYDYTAWHSFSYSNETWAGVPPAGPDGQYVAYPNSGAGGSANYGVCFGSSEEVTDMGGDVYDATSYVTFDLPDNHQIQSMYVANNTYAWDSMKYGDSFAKKFGGDSGNDEDWFRLRITGLDAAGDPIAAGPVDVYLADFRLDEDYILESWEFVDLIALGEAAKLQFSLKSTDVGQYGMNTPGFFLIDNLSLKQTPEPSTILLLVSGALTMLVWWRRRKSSSRTIAV